ncbi:MAG TPA: SRPBCC domain-containing protein, partial [Flavisolibacter sp.]|nr:SRPBCC domain-containing protein [Flavisolibacter sp.]
MLTEPLQIKTGIRVARPASVVFEAIADPQNMKNYFISQGSGRMTEGATVEWGFPEISFTFPVHVKKAEPGKLISFTWTNVNGKETLVTITLTAVDDATTFITITEGEEEPTPQGLQWLKSNTEGWANFLACLKAWLEYGINLRKGAFDPSQMPQ